MKNNYYFWRHTNPTIPKFQQYLEKIDLLCSEETAGLDIEKLRGADSLFCLRLDYAARLIFTYFKGKVFLLELLENHQYHRSRFLKNPQFVKYVLDTLARSEHLSPVDVPVDGKTSKAIPLELHQNQFIQFSKEQEEILQASFPFGVAAPAGCGKTCLGISMMSYIVNLALEADMPMKIAYVTKSNPLALQQKNHWQITMPELPKTIDIDFVTYSQLLPAGIQIIGSELSYFKTWFKDVERLLPYPADTVWQEFRILSGLDSLEQYLGLGKKQSLILELEDKQKCFSLYESYQKYLKGACLCSPSLFKLDKHPIYNFIVVDEAQDLSYGQLANLNGLAKESKIVYFLGDHQLLFDVKSKLNFIKNMYHQAGIAFSVLSLTQSYRCPPQVIELANCIIQTKYLVTGGLVDSVENSTISIADGFQDKPGQVSWIQPKNEMLRTEILLHAQQHYFAILVMDEALTAEVAEFFQCDPVRIFTPETIKGLEFKMVVVWKPLIGVEAKEVNKLLPAISLDEEKQSACAAVHRPKPGQGHEAYLHFFNRLITAVTRCQQTLIWIETEQSRPIENLIGHLKKGFEGPVAKIASLEASKQEDWQQLVIEYYYQDNILGAQEIFTKYLKDQYLNFEQFCQMHGLVKTVEMISSVDEQEEKAAVAAVSARPFKEYVFEHEFFNSKQKKEDWSYKSEIQEIIDRELLSQRLADFLKKFKSGQGLDNFLFKEKSIKVIESKRKTNHYCFMDWLNTSPSIWMFVTALASHTQLLAKISIKKLKQYLGEQHRIIPLLNNLEQVQEYLYQQLALNHITPEDVLNPAIDMPVIHFLLKFNRLDLLAAVGTAGAPLDALDADGNSLLHAAALKQDYQSIDFLYRLGFDLNSLNKDKKTIGFLAILLGDLDLFDMLTSYEFDWHKKEANLKTPLQQAVSGGQLEMVSVILKINPNSLDYLNGLMLFHLALTSPHPSSMFKLLLSFKLDPFVVSYGQKDVLELLMESTDYNEHRLAILADLNESGVCLQSWKAKNEFNLAHLAACHDRVEVIDWLKTNEKLLPLFNISSKVTLPIEEAIKSKKVNALQALVLLGEVGGFKPALFEKFAIGAMFSGEEQIIDVLHSAGVPFNFGFQSGCLMHLAVRLNKPNLILALKNKGELTNQGNDVDETPFLLAAKENKINCLQQLLEFDDLDIGATNKQGNNVFHFLAINNQFDLIADLFCQPRFRHLALKPNLIGHTPFFLGVKNNHFEVVHTLLAHGVIEYRNEYKNLDIVYWALKHDNVDMLTLLDEFKFGICHTIDGQSPLHIAILENRFLSFKYFLTFGPKDIPFLGESFSPLFMIASLGKFEFLPLLKEIYYDFYQTNKAGENLLHALMQSDLPPIVIKQFMFNLRKLNINIHLLLFQTNVSKKDPMFYLLDKKQIEVIEYVEELFRVLWPIDDDDVEKLRNITSSHVADEDEAESAFGHLANPALGLAANYLKHAASTGNVEVIQFLVELYQTKENSQAQKQMPTMFVRKFAALEEVLWDCVFIAIEHGQLESLKMLTKLGVPIDRLDLTFTYTSMECAIKFKQLQILKFMVTKFNFLVTKEAYSLVHSAAMYDACEILRWLYSQVPLSPMFALNHPLDDRGFYEEALPVMVAAGSGSLNALKTLKNECGADLRQSVAKDYDAIWFTIGHDFFNRDVLEYLVSEGCDINKEYDGGQKTLLIKTALYGHIEALPILLSFGAQLDWMCKETKKNILLYCISNNQVDYLKALMAYPIDLTHVDVNGFNALHTAVMNSNFEILEWMLSQEVFHPLIKMEDNFGRKPVFLAKQEHESEMVELFEKITQKSPFTFFQAQYEMSTESESVIEKGP